MSNNNDNDSKWLLPIVITFLTILSPIIIRFFQKAIIYNDLQLPIRVYVNDIDQGIIPAQSAGNVFFDAPPAAFRFELATAQFPNSEPMGGEFRRLNYLNVLHINNDVSPEFYFSPTISNNTSQSCDVFINDDLSAEKFAGVIPANAKNVIPGYFHFYGNSNVTLYCGSTSHRWDNLQSYLMPNSGAVILTLDPPTVESTTPTQDPCYDSMPSRLSRGAYAIVSDEQPDPNTLRIEPVRGSAEISKVYPNGIIEIVDGPICQNGWRWWYVKPNEKEIYGWTPEGNISNYWLIPYYP